jgi:NitT/TauT family transport system substrate-binding protein
LRQWRPSCFAPIHVAEPLLREEGFTDLQYVTAHGADYQEMLRDGEVDLSPEFSALTIYNVEKHNYPLKILAGLHVGCIALIGGDRVSSVGDLKGKTVWAGPVENMGPHIFFSVMVAYLGLDPRKDINYVWVEKDEAMRRFREGKIDAVMSFPPGPYELIDEGIGRVLVDTNVDRPWSQYFCCMINGHSDFVKNNPVATRRAIRAILKANDICARDPEYALKILQQKNIWTESETKYILQALKEIPYGKWREYSPEDVLRFFLLRMHEVGMVEASPQEFIAQHTDWRFVNELKSEMNMTW